jgi:uncharacterized protein (TIGR02246 family)
MAADVTAVARDFYATLEKAWNDADGAVFGSAFAAGASFVDIRGVAHDGSAEIGTGHQGIFDTIYKSSVVHIEMETARALTDDVILARGRSTLEVPSGPMAGTIRALNSIVLVRTDGAWQAASFHNTVVTG